MKWLKMQGKFTNYFLNFSLCDPIDPVINSNFRIFTWQGHDLGIVGIVNVVKIFSIYVVDNIRLGPESISDCKYLSVSLKWSKPIN